MTEKQYDDILELKIEELTKYQNVLKEMKAEIDAIIAKM
jgi:hypothetical protein